MARHVIGRVGDPPAGSAKEVVVAGISIALFNVDGNYYALLNRCPHQGACLDKGLVVGSLSSTRPGDYDYDADRCLVRCPWHGWEFELATGRSWFDPARQRIRTYGVSVESGHTILDTRTGGDTRKLPGPYLAETFPISIEDDYLVIEIKDVKARSVAT
jgi:nitrite reductase/ring-hydroxylating ferredoxin subunit